MDLRNKTCSHEGTENELYFFYQIIFRFNKKKKTIYEARMYTLISFCKLSQFGDSQPFKYAIFMFHNAMKKTLVDQSKRTAYYPNYYKCF